MPLLWKNGGLVWYNGGLAYDVDLCDCVCGEEPPGDCCSLLFDGNREYEVVIEGYTFIAGDYNGTYVLSKQTAADTGVEIQACEIGLAVEEVGTIMRLFYNETEGRWEFRFSEEEAGYEWRKVLTCIEASSTPTELDEVTPPAGSGSVTVTPL
jgi:hypothetical protein